MFANQIQNYNTILYNTLFAAIKFTNWKVHSLFTSKNFNGFLFIYLFVCLQYYLQFGSFIKNEIKKQITILGEC